MPAALALALAVFPPPRADAFDLDYEIGADVSYSDNITLSENAPEADTVFLPTARFDISQAGADVRISGNGLVQYSDYLDDTFQDEFRGRFAGGLDWTIVPSRLDLVFQDYLSEETIEDLDRSTPDNLQQVNLFVAGPSVYARFGPATRGQFDFRYGNTYAQESEAFNGDRYSVAARVRHELNATTEVTGNLEAARIQYDPAGAAADYDRYDAYLTYKLRREALELELNLGYSQLELTAKKDSPSSPLVRGAATWDLSPRSRIRADVRYQFSDATQYLITPTLEFGDRQFSYIGYTDIVVEPDVFRERSARIGYYFTGNRTSWRLQPYYRRIDNLNTLADDQGLRGVAFNIEHRISPLLSVSLVAIVDRRKYEDLSREDQDTTVEAAMTRRFNRHWSGRVGVRHRERDSSTPDQGYDENVALLSIAYKR